MTQIGIVGTGFVADLYMRSLRSFPQLNPCVAYDIRSDRLAAFCGYWAVAATEDLQALCAELAPGSIVLNLTNPQAHAAVSRTCLEAGHHVYSEKPLALDYGEARALHLLAEERGLLLGAAPCNFLGASMQTAMAAVRNGKIGRVRLIYAELDDEFIPAAPYRRWHSETGAPWPAEDEFTVGCTLEHSGYYLAPLIALFGRVRNVVASSSSLLSDLLPVPAPGADFSVAIISFESGPVVRLTCSIVAPHNHGMRIFGDDAILETGDCWNNSAAVRLRRRFVLRRRLITAPFARRLRVPRNSHPMLGRRGASAMNFALGPAEMAAALAENRPPRISADLALHVTEVALAIHNASAESGAMRVESHCEPIPLMPWAK